jgi:hypothetical protein
LAQLFLRSSPSGTKKTLAESEKVSTSEAKTRIEGQLEFEHFAAYGFSVDYPTDCLIEMKPRANREVGEVAFKFPRGNVFFLTWGQLGQVEKFHGAEGHADFSIDRIRKNRDAKITNLKRDSIEVNGHPAPFNRVWVEVVRRGLILGSTRRAHEIRSIHVHCENTGRYFLMYVQGAAETSDQQESVMARMALTFKCH